jgi:hypothetical protein
MAILPSALIGTLSGSVANIRGSLASPICGKRYSVRVDYFIKSSGQLLSGFHKWWFRVNLIVSIAF